jgi:hypothetical protein
MILKVTTEIHILHSVYAQISLYQSVHLPNTTLNVTAEFHILHSVYTQTYLNQSVHLPNTTLKITAEFHILHSAYTQTSLYQSVYLPNTTLKVTAEFHILRSVYTQTPLYNQYIYQIPHWKLLLNYTFYFQYTHKHSYTSSPFTKYHTEIYCWISHLHSVYTQKSLYQSVHLPNTTLKVTAEFHILH